MASTPESGAARRTSYRFRELPPAEKSSWITFAGAMLAIVGTLNIIYGIAAIDDSRVYAGDDVHVFGTLNTWGWFMLFAGILQLFTAAGVWRGNELARWAGVLLALANAVILFIFLPAFPLLVLALIAVDVLVIYALLAHGGLEAR